MKLTKGQQEKIQKAFKGNGFDRTGSDLFTEIVIDYDEPTISTRRINFLTKRNKKSMFDELRRAFKCLTEINKILKEQSRIGKGGLR